MKKGTLTRKQTICLHFLMGKSVAELAAHHRVSVEEIEKCLRAGLEWKS